MLFKQTKTFWRSLNYKKTLGKIYLSSDTYHYISEGGHIRIEIWLVVRMSDADDSCLEDCDKVVKVESHLTLVPCQVKTF